MNMEKEYKIHVTRYALEQMEEIKQYIVHELLAPQAAKSLLSTLQKTITSLRIMPFRNPLVHEEKWRKQGIRKTIIKNFLVYYWIDEEKETVYITAVVYGKRDQLRQLDNMNLK